jgi:hypothetical protein
VRVFGVGEAPDVISLEYNNFCQACGQDVFLDSSSEQCEIGLDCWSCALKQWAHLRDAQAHSVERCLSRLWTLH